MGTGNKDKFIGIGILVLIVIAVVVLYGTGAFGSSNNAASKLPYSYVPSCAAYNNCTSSPCPSGSYLNNSLGYCDWNYTSPSQNSVNSTCNGSSTCNFTAVAQPSCPPGAAYQNITNCKAEGGSCMAGYTYDKRNGLCEPLPESCKSGYSLYADNSTHECLLNSACGNGYSLTFNDTTNTFLCIR